ncbi:hypothetical protein L2K20_06110 [Mycobacterium sp. MBM]|nr:hypothetical protein [Mycobacterium sp. MBM]
MQIAPLSLLTSKAQTSDERDRELPERPPIELPMPVVDGFDQEGARAQRRRSTAVWLGPDFDLGAEVEAVCRPLAVEVSAILGLLVLRDQTTGRVAFHDEIDELADQVHEVRRKVLEMLAVSPVRARTELTAAAVVRRPEFSHGDVLAGTWVDLLAAYTGVLSGDLSGLLERSAVGRRPGALVAGASVELFLVLRSVDHAARRLEGRFRSVREKAQCILDEPRYAAEVAARREAQRQARELQQLGLR